MADPEETLEGLLRRLAVSLAAVVVVALVVAGVLGAATLAATHYLVPDEPSTASDEPTMYVPTPTSPSPGSSAGDGEGSEAGQDQGRSGQDGAKKDDRGSKGDKAGKKRRGAGDIVLHARPQRAAPFQRVRLFGRYPGGNGTTLQVQRRQGRWVFFPTSATVQGGRFETWIQSGRRGVNEFRVVDRSTGEKSKTVEVRIRPRR